MGALKFSVCIEMIFNDRDILDRIEAVAKAGYPAFEFWGWKQKDMDAIKAKADAVGVNIAGFCVQTDAALVNPETTATWVEEARDSVAEAKRLGVPVLIVTTGQEIPDMSRVDQHVAVVNGLKGLAPVAEDAGVDLVLEPLNILVDHKGYYLATSDEGFEVLEEVGSPRVKLLYDIYHQQITEGNLIERITAGISRIGHFHVADVPGRFEPGTGEINYANVFRRIGELDYSGHVGLEFRCSGTPEAALAQVRQIAGL
ncbi:MAG: TIM barrel protein [Armatimonadetes bacterium]|nr:TIM barrel protein [Armatimonadota bacterium]